MKLTELVLLFTTKGADETKAKTEKVKSSVIALATTYLSLKKVLNEVSSYTKGGEELGLLAENAGVGAEKIQAYGQALQNYGGNLSSIATTFKGLNQQIQDMRFGKGGALQEASIRYGLSLNVGSAEDVLRNVAKRMESLTKSEQLDLGKQLGLDNATIQLVSRGLDNFNAELERARQNPLYSEEDVKTSRQFQMSLRDLQLSIQKIWGVVARALMPTITAVMKIGSSIFEYISKHKGFILGILGSITLAFVLLKATIIKTWISALAPMLPIIAILTLIGLAVDDLITYFEGGDSIIGSFFNTIDKGVQEFLNWIDGLLDKVDEFTVQMIKMLVDAFSQFSNWVKGIFTGIWGSITSGIISAINFVIGAYNKVAKYIPGLSEMDLLQTGANAMEETNTPLNTMATNQTFNTNNASANNSIKIDNISVNTQATDSAGISAGIGGALTNEFDNLLNENTAGVYA